MAVASRGLFATGVSTDLNGECASTATFLAQNETLPRLANSLQNFSNPVTYLSSGGKIGDKIMAVGLINKDSGSKPNKIILTCRQEVTCDKCTTLQWSVTVHSS